jgi:hypothetical protein
MGGEMSKGRNEYKENNDKDIKSGAEMKYRNFEMKQEEVYNILNLKYCLSCSSVVPVNRLANKV